ncbi:MAG: two-component system, OmpR family, response regulator [Bryobacterales bacterium]|jgi:CheY-like chemotaxis protein/anti-sigma regulatory factor (Ser/Thr protein kinase)|nr:two-component system, OmpR family, response regulator [Bryobacterales bacterium]
MPELKRILIVDDDPDVHDLLKIALRGEDREVGSAFDGLEGLKRVENEPWDLVITDILMPGLDGMALLERIHRLCPETRVVVMTVANTAENIVHAIRDHAFAWFGKPFTVEAVREMVEHALNSKFSDDDIEVLSASPQWLGLKLRCKMDTAARIVQFLREMEKGLPAEEQEKVASAFREILLNAIEHGGGNDPDKSVTITYVRSERALLYYVRDPGQGFSFAKLKHAAVSNPAEAPMDHLEARQQLGMRAGGFGILMTRSLVDDLIYNEMGNEVLLIKYLKR